MQKWVEQIWDQQVGLDEYLPGTPHRLRHRDISEDFPYHVLGPQAVASVEEQLRRLPEPERHFREQDAVRRRQFPSCFEEACAYGNLSAAVLMWSQGVVHVPTRRAVYEGNNASALMWASLKGHLPLVRFLLDHGAPIEATNSLGHTALQWAITTGQHDVVRLLLDHGADPNHRDRQSFDAAFVAVQSGQLALLLMLTEDAAREGRLLPTTNDGLVFYQPPPSAPSEMPENPRTKKAYFALDPRRRDVEGHSLLHWAAYRNSVAMCQYLLDHWGFGVNVQDSLGRTPLVWAAREGFAEVIEVLLSRGADRRIPDKEGWTALQYARERNHPEARYVLESYPYAAVERDEEMTDDHAGGDTGEGATETLLSSSPSTVGEPATRLGSGGGGEVAPGPGGGGSRGCRYVCVRDRRAYGTLRAIRDSSLFAVMAVAGPVYVGVMFLILHVLPPLLSYVPFTFFLFKNVVWTALSPRPIQSSRPVATSASPYAQMGITSSIAASARGTWRFRRRDPANLFLWLTFIAVQVWAWNNMGLMPLFSFVDNTPARAAMGYPTTATGGRAAAAAADTTTGTPPAIPVHFFGMSLLRRLTFQVNPLDTFTEVAATVAMGGPAATTSPAYNAAVAAYTKQSHQLVQGTLMSLVVMAVAAAVGCKVLASRSILRPSEEGTLRSSPVWRILAARQYRWLHARFVFLERHLQLPLRAFYCPERDVVVRGYDGYSSLLDTPVGASNRRLFALALTCFALYELLLLIWGIQQTRLLLRCPPQVPWYTDAFLAFQSGEVLTAIPTTTATTTAAAAAAISMAPKALGATNLTRLSTRASFLGAEDENGPRAMATAVLAAATPVVSLAWLNTAMEILLHGLPCRQYRVLEELTASYATATTTMRTEGEGAGTAAPSRVASYLRQFLYLFAYYIWPTRASVLGVWVFHYSALATVWVGCLALRQWRGVYRGATCMELANPVAQGNDGTLVSIFPADVQKAQRVDIIDEEEERYYQAVCPEKVRTGGKSSSGGGGRCVYANGNGLVNVAAFVVGRDGVRWRGAMAISSHNTPSFTPLLE